MENLIPYGRQYIDKKDLSAVQQSLRNEKITTGAYVEKFEKKINQFLKCKYSVSCNSGTSALFLAFKAIDLNKNDKVIMPSINFISSYNIAKLFGAQIFLADVDKSTGQMTPDDIEECCKKFKLKNVKALVVMYNGGYPQNADKFFKLKKKYGFKIIEDACHALGAEYVFKKKIYKIGSCKHSDISTFSFHPLKTITTGEGGAFTTNDKKLYKRAELFRSHGILRNKIKHWTYKINNAGFNYRLSELNCALGVSQLENINQILSKREKLKRLYISKFKSLKNIIKLPKYEKCISSNHLFLILINFKKIKSSKNKFFLFMKNKGIYLQQHYIPIYKLISHKIAKKNFPNTEKYFEQSVSLPIHFDISVKDINKVVKEIKNFMLLNK